MFYFKLALMILFQPQQALVLIKRRRKQMPFFIPLILLTLCVAVNIASIYVTHFLLSDVNPDTANLSETVLSLLIPILSLVGGIHLVTSIRDGETTFFETLTAVCYCLIPYIVLTLPISLLSRILTLNEMGLYQALTVVTMLWCVLLVIYSIGQLNTYTFGQTLWNSVLSVLVVLFIWAVLILLYILGEQLVDFIAQVLNEYRLLHL